MYFKEVACIIVGGWLNEPHICRAISLEGMITCHLKPQGHGWSRGPQAGRRENPEKGKQAWALLLLGKAQSLWARLIRLGPPGITFLLWCQLIRAFNLIGKNPYTAALTLVFDWITRRRCVCATKRLLSFSLAKMTYLKSITVMHQM